VCVCSLENYTNRHWCYSFRRRHASPQLNVPGFVAQRFSHSFDKQSHSEERVREFLFTCVIQISRYEATFVRSEVLTTGLMNIEIFCDVYPAWTFKWLPSFRKGTLRNVGKYLPVCDLTSHKFHNTWIIKMHYQFLFSSAGGRKFLLYYSRCTPTGAWMFVYCECCVLSGRGLCDGLMTRPEGPYRLWCVVMRGLETSRMRRPWPRVGLQCHKKKNPVA